MAKLQLVLETEEARPPSETRELRKASGSHPASAFCWDETETETETQTQTQTATNAGVLSVMTDLGESVEDAETDHDFAAGRVEMWLQAPAPGTRAWRLESWADAKDFHSSYF